MSHSSPPLPLPVGLCARCCADGRALQARHLQRLREAAFCLAGCMDWLPPAREDETVLTGGSLLEGCNKFIEHG